MSLGQSQTLVSLWKVASICLGLGVDQVARKPWLRMLGGGKVGEPGQWDWASPLGFVTHRCILHTSLTLLVSGKHSTRPSICWFVYKHLLIPSPCVMLSHTLG